MKIKMPKVSRAAYVVAALAVAVAGLAPALRAHASAYGQITTRSIEMSSAAASASGTTYLVSFTETAVGVVKSVDIDFCSSANTPLFGDTCATPTATFSGASAVLSAQSGTSGWTLTQGTNHLVISGSSFNTATAMSFTITTITNPSAIGTFYARIYTYAAQSNDYSSVTAPGTVFDFGGIALSTTATIVITAKVMETLTFCVASIDLTTSNCTSAGANPPNLTLGTGSPVTLDSNGVYRGSVFTQISTNASTGATVRMKALNTCSNAGLSSNGGGTCNISGMDNTAASAMTAGSSTQQFGLFVATGGLSTGGSGSGVADGNYHDAAHVNVGTGDLFYGMDNTTSSGGVASTYGDPIFTTNSLPCSLVNNQLVFAATASLTTPAGVYLGNESLVAMGSF